MSVQSLLLPEQLHLSTREIAVIENYREILEKSGFEFECFGHDTLMVKATPALIADIDLKTLFEKIAAELEEKGKLESIEKILEELFALIACHRQIRGGDKLSILEMEALLKEMQRLKITHCPHGRPLLIRVEKNEIERRLKRI